MRGKPKTQTRAKPQVSRLLGSLSVLGRRLSWRGSRARQGQHEASWPVCKPRKPDVAAVLACETPSRRQAQTAARAPAGRGAGEERRSQQLTLRGCRGGAVILHRNVHVLGAAGGQAETSPAGRVGARWSGLNGVAQQASERCAQLDRVGVHV